MTQSEKEVMPKCGEKRLADGSCIRAMTGLCGDAAARALAQIEEGDR